MFHIHIYLSDRKGRRFLSHKTCEKRFGKSRISPFLHCSLVAGIYNVKLWEKIYLFLFLFLFFSVSISYGPFRNRRETC